jgi:hypothetical protein
MSKETLRVGILIILLTTGCNKEKRIITDEIQTISIDVEKSRDFLLSDFVKIVSYIPLETNQHSVISSVDKIYTYKDEFYILDKKQNAIYIFSSDDGKYKRRLKNQGKGNGEYFEITDFSVDRENGTILILDNISRSFYLYTINGEFIKNIKTKNTLYFCELYGNKIIGYSDNFIYSEEYNLHVYDINSGISDHFLPINKNLKDYQSQKGGQFMLNSNNHMLFKERLSYTIYSIDSTGLKSYYYMDFGDCNMPDNYFNRNVSFDELLYNLNDGTYAAFPTIFLENSSLIYFSYQFKNFRHVVYYKKTGKILNGKVIDDINNLYFATPLYSDGRAFYSILEPMSIMNYFKYLKSGEDKESQILWKNITDNKSNEILFSLDGNDNPVIIKYLLKL